MKRVKNRNRESAICYYLQNFNEDEYEKYINNGIKKQCEYIVQCGENQRKDHFFDYDVPKVKIYDVLSNDGVSKLIKCLHRLPHKKYNISNITYKKSTLFPMYDYVHMQESHTLIVSVGKIEFTESKYIENICISMTQINNAYALLEYDISFKMCMLKRERNKFILEYLGDITNDDYFSVYSLDDDYKLEIIDEMNEDFFLLICQHFITTLLYSENGKKRKLLNIVYKIRKKQLNIDTIYLGDEVCFSYYNRKENYILQRNYNRESYVLFAGNDEIPNFSFCEYIKKYGNALYYRIMGEDELKYLEIEFSKYISGRKKVRFSKKYMELLKRVTSFSDVQVLRSSEEDLIKGFNNNWDYYIGNNKDNIENDRHIEIKRYKEIYEHNYEYMKVLAEINYTKSSQTLALLSLIVAVIAIICA